MVQHTPRKGLPYPVVDDDVKIASRDIRDLAFGVDTELSSSEARLASNIRNVDDRVTSTSAQLRSDIDVQGEYLQQLLAEVETAYDVAVANGFTGTPAQWLESLRGGPGPEGPYGGTSVTDPQVASMVSADTATAAALKEGFIERHGTRGQTRTLYVRATGDDTNSGRSPESAFREIRSALNSLSDEGPVIRGSVRIDVGPGVYQGGIRLPVTRGSAQDDFIRIIGPNVNGHPNAPTAVIDYAADPTATFGMLAEDGAHLWLQDLKFIGGFHTAVRVDRNTYLQWRNVHVDGQNQGNAGLAITSQCRYYVTGGIIENLTNGIQEHFQITRGYGTVSSADQQLIVRNCHVGVKCKENCVGHFDYINVTDCNIGIEMQLYSGANMKGAVLERNKMGIVLTNSEIHNEQSIAWGTNEDANTRRILSLGSSSELTLFGWEQATDNAPTLRTGHRPLVTIGADYNDKTVGNTTSETTIVSFNRALRGDWYSIQGKHAKIILWGSTPSGALTADFRIILRLSGSEAGQLRLPAGLSGPAHFRAEFDIVAAQDGASQKIFGTVNIGGAPSSTILVTRQIDLSTQDRTASVHAIPGSANDSVQIRLAEIWG